MPAIDGKRTVGGRCLHSVADPSGPNALVWPRSESVRRGPASEHRHMLHTGSSKDVEVVTRQDVTFIQVPDFREQHLFGVRNSSSATGISAMIDHQQSRLHTVCKVSELFG